MELEEKMGLIADAFRSVGVDRRQALWEFTTKDTSIELFILW